MLLFVEGIVFEIVFDFMFFQPGIVLLAAIPCIATPILGLHPFGKVLLLHVRNEAGRVPSLLMNAVPDNELVLCPDLNIVRWARQRLLGGTIFLHAQVAGVRVGLGLALASC